MRIRGLSIRKMLMRPTAIVLLASFSFEIFYPSAAYALTGGPSQPEVSGFEPIGTSDMVDPFSGDFTYNIPLLDVDGYPINISYHSGVTMDQEASWVGLGWNINVGTVNRSMRGLPDDFNGDNVIKELNLKPNRTYGVTGSFSAELFGLDTSNRLKYQLGINYNNYTGVGIELSVAASFAAFNKMKNPLTGGLGITSSSENGVSVTPSIGLDMTSKKLDAIQTSVGGTIGLGFNSRGGLTQLTITPSVSSVGQREANKRSKKSSQDSWSAGGSFDFGYSTYTPSINMSMHNFSVNARFTLGGELFGFHGNYGIGGYYASQKLATTYQENPAYGYMYVQDGQEHSNALLDFNRERDGSFTLNAKALPLTNFTYDIYSVSGQGVGGSYRPFRSDVGYVFDSRNTSSSEGYSIGVELGGGNLFHGGTQVSVNISNSEAGGWTQQNRAVNSLKFHRDTPYGGFEPVYFKEANEKSVDSDPGFFNAYGGFEPQYFELDQRSTFNVELSGRMIGEDGAKTLSPSNYRGARDKRNQVIAPLNRDKLDDGFGLDDVHGSAYGAPGHHTAEITTYSTDGSRYVYGIAAYNTTQKDVTFSVGDGLYSDNGHTGDCTTGLVSYTSDIDNSVDNTKGDDNYFSRTTTPAYAHSYLLTAVLSSDYVDSDNIKGPSDADLGYYTKFHYSKVSNYKWRVPVQANTATFNEGLKTNPHDDKASYVYGEKELWYLDSIVGKNHIAIFHTEAREDGLGVLGENGGKNTDTTKAQRKLKKISLYVLKEYRDNPSTAVPVKEVHFVYDYSLCQNVPNQETSGQGKLTLKKIYFTYQNSNKARLSPYEFTYHENNPDYNLSNYDRWGNYKPNYEPGCDVVNDALSPAEFPYVTQNKDSADYYASAWSLTDIDLPSGGKIHVDYESDDYAWVQHKRAMQMFKIVGVEGHDVTSINDNNVLSLSDDSNENRRIYFQLHPDYTGDLSEYFKGVRELYFRCLMVMDPDNPSESEYVSGYAQIEEYGPVTWESTNLGYVELSPVKLKDNGSTIYNPIVKTANQFGRLHLPQFIWDQPGVDENASFGSDVMYSLVSSFANLGELFTQPNVKLWNREKGTKLVTNKSWIRLNNPNKQKFGGGLRVKRILLSDEWSDMTSGAEDSYEYGQEYEYTLRDGTSSGVASYEPQLGGDENPWKQPDTYDEELKMAPDEKFYSERPYGEVFFPSASVGYSNVTIRNLSRDNVTRHATGKVVHEFYTAKDFPTIVEFTDLIPLQEKTDPFSIASLLYVRSKDYMTATQGFVVETNDMHGKPKKQSVFQEGIPQPITSVEYIYQADGYVFDSDAGTTTTTETFSGTKRLNNSVQVIDEQGNLSQRNIGVFFDMVADFREQKSEVIGGSLNLNVDAFLPAFPVPLIIPMILPSIQHEQLQFRSATTTKVIQRFGLVKEVRAKDLGSFVTTHNETYDSETGEVLLTRTKTDFNDDIYSMNYPAHWYYDGMGAAYKNIGFSTANLTFDANGYVAYANASSYYFPGDELALSTGTKAWVTSVTTSGFSIIDKEGDPITGAVPFIVTIRSGRRNMQMMPVAAITALSNPLTGIKNNSYTNVLQASAVELTEGWRTFCDCFDGSDTSLAYTSNPYVLGTKGNWRVKRSWLHLSPRTQSNYNDNTNIRKDGVFTSFNPFFKLTANGWKIDERNWTFVSEVTEFSPFGAELENKDALGRYSAATFGYRQTLPTAVAANARYTDIGFDGFEDYGFSPCADNHFKFPSTSNIVSNQSHSGRKSVKVSNGTPVFMTKALEKCEPEGCTLAINSTEAGSYIAVTVSGATSTFPEFDWNIIQGEPIVVFASGQMRLSGTGWTVEVTVTDGYCKTIKVISR
jgi:hypothetical protein